MQSFISGIAGALNSTLNKNVDPNEAKLAHLLNAISPGDNPDLETDVSKLTLSYAQNRRSGGTNYTIGIPDNFILKEKTEDRDFIAYSPDGAEDDGFTDADIVFYAGQSMSADQLDTIKSNEAREALCERLLKEMMSSTPVFKMMFQDEKTVPFSCEETAGAYTRAYSDNTLHVNALVVVPGGTQMFRLQINNITKKDYEKCDGLIQGWLSTIKINGKLPQLTALTDPELISSQLNKKLTDRIMEVAEDNRTSVFTRMNALVNSAVIDFKQEQNNGGGSLIRLKKSIRPILEDSAERVQKVYQDLVDVFLYHNENSSDDKQIYSFYTKATEWINKETKSSLTLDGDKTVAEYTRVPALLKSMKTDRISAIEKKTEEEEKRKKELQQKKKKYDEATNDLNVGNIASLTRAVTAFKALGDYEDAASKAAYAERNLGIAKREEEQRKEGIYTEAVGLLNDEKATAASLTKAQNLFRSISDYKDAQQLSGKATRLLGQLNVYNGAVKSAAIGTIKDLSSAVSNLKTIAGFRDSDALIEQYQNRIAELEAQAEAERREQERQRLEAERLEAERKAEEERQVALRKKKTKRRIIVFIILALLAVLAGIVGTQYIIPESKYKEAASLAENGDYRSAMELYQSLGQYKDSQKLAKECKPGATYQDATDALDAGQYEQAMKLFGSINYEDSAYKKTYAEGLMYLESASKLIDQKNYSTAVEYLVKVKGLELQELQANVDQYLYDAAEKAYKAGQYEAANTALYSITDESLIDSELKKSIDTAYAAKKAEEERKAREKLIEDSYQELITTTVNEDNIAHIEELFVIIPSNYKNAASYKRTFDFYKPYIGTYTLDGYSQKKSFVLFWNMTGYEGQWVGYIDGGVFVYPNLYVSYPDKYKGTWTISGRTITHVYTGARTFTTVYRKQ